MGNVTVWGSNGSMWPGMRVAAFLNQNLVDTSYEPFEIDEIKDRTKEARPRRLLPNVSY